MDFLGSSDLSFLDGRFETESSSKFFYRLFSEFFSIKDDVLIVFLYSSF